MVKRCKVCQQEKDIVEFSPDAKEKDGFRRVCKVCRALQRRLSRDIEREKNQTLSEALDVIETVAPTRLWGRIKTMPQPPPVSIGPCQRCETLTADWHPANLYEDPDDVIHLCPECWEQMKKDVGTAIFMSLRKVKWQRDSLEAKIEKERQERDQMQQSIDRENRELEKIDPMDGVYDPEDPPEVQAQDIARWEQTQAQMKLGEAKD